MAYKKVGWKDYPSTDTPINATNLDHMDAGILENAQTIGDKTKISGIGDGTIAGAIEQNTQSLTNVNNSKKTYLRLILFTVKFCTQFYALCCNPKTRV